MRLPIAHMLWQQHQALAHACLNHPFVQGIADGTLKKAKFAFYIGQDAFFLQAFARAYSIAAAKTPDWEGWCLFHSLAQGVLSERQLHESYALEWGVTLKEVEPAPVTRRYIDFLLATAWGTDVGRIAVAMCPCLRLYVFLGQTLAKNGIPKHPYADWIRTYSSEEFEKLAQKLEQKIDSCVVSVDAVDADYQYALICERDFFAAAWEIE